MTLGTLFLVLALLLFALLGMGVTVIPRAEYWAWVCLTLGLLLGAIPLRPWPWP